MKPDTPSSISRQDKLNKSVYRTLVGNVSPGNGLTFDANGQPLTYSPDNMAGIIIRIGSTANPNGLPAAWPAANTNLTIAHNLNKVPYGFIVLAKYAAADVFLGTIAPTKTQITLQTTNPNTDITIWVLV